MARVTSRFVCQSCGTVHARWNGRCEGCGAWNSVIEESVTEPGGHGLGAGRGSGGGGRHRLEVVALAGASPPAPRCSTGISEFDRVCGGGLVPGSVLLVGGDPGIGKSTLLLQVVARLSLSQTCLYVSGEEAVDQVRLRAVRLGVAESQVRLAAATSVRDIVATLESPERPAVAVIDSIQTMAVDTLESAPGTVAQVRASAQELIRVAKRRQVVVILVGHVTKDGAIAGPRVLEHMVDTVLYFEGERGHHFRILRAIKNRFGATDEIGVFEMGDRGLAEVPNPSMLFLSGRRGDVSGAAVFAGIEGTRPVLVEIQALVAPSPLGTPRRAVVGWDNARLAMVLAVLEARCGVSIGGNDVYLNVAGGLKISEPAADLAVAAALLSSLSGEPVPAQAVVFGEIGLAGEVRTVGQTDLRLREAAKLGFGEALVPARHGRGRTNDAGLRVVEINQLDELLPLFSSLAANGARKNGSARPGRKEQA